MLRKWTLALIILSLTMIPAFAQDKAAPKQPASQDNLSFSKQGLVSLDFRDADIQNVLRILSYKSGVNIVAGPEVTGQVTIKLQDVPWQKALQVVLETYGYASERRGNIITVTTIENLKKRREDSKLLSQQEPLVTKTFILNYAKATDVVESISKMKTERGSMNIDARTNAVIVRDVPENVELIADVIKKLDKTTPQVLIEAKIVETTLNNTDKLGIDWVLQASLTGASRPTVWPFTKHSDNKYLKNDDFPAADSGDFTFGTLSFAQAQAAFEALSTRSDTNVLSNPRIVTLDNKMAKINVGSQYPFPQYEYNQEQAKLQISGWEYKDIGIIFDVTPHVNNAGYVTLDIDPKVTAILDYVSVESTQVPQLSIEAAHTSVMIKDGETLVIAGLIKDQTVETKKKVPILGSIPILGWPFQKTEKTAVKTDLLIFLTPHILNADKATEQEEDQKP
jgi:type IV pilus assembly protein PilQ